MTMITPSYLGETIEYSSLHACRSTLEDPTLSRFSPRYGERLKGIAVAVSLKRGATPVTVAVRLRQVCAGYFRDTFLYY